VQSDIIIANLIGLRFRVLGSAFSLQDSELLNFEPIPLESLNPERGTFEPHGFNLPTWDINKTPEVFNILSCFIKRSTDSSHRFQVDRRGFIKFGFMVAVAATFEPARAIAVVTHRLNSKRNLSFFNTHTDEHLDVCYCQDGVFRSGALNRIKHILRDHRTGDIKAIDTRVLDILHSLSRRLDTPGPFHIISGYRSPATNAALHKKSAGVASRSFHTQGMAIDFRVPNYKTSTVHAAAVNLRAGGVGYYRKSDFVHVDCGPVRYW
jgi:uncharacterized protein YcbK (DUF882 family)